MHTRSANRAAEERALIEQAKAKLEEAFVLLHALEGKLDATDVMLGRDPLDATRRAQEREKLLAEVEEAQREALRLARRSRRVSRIRVRAKNSATMERAPALTLSPAAESELAQTGAMLQDVELASETLDDMGFDDSAFDDAAGCDDQEATPAPVIDEVERADAVERMLEAVARAVRVTEPATAVDPNHVFDHSGPSAPTQPHSEQSAESIAERAAAIFAVAAQRVQRSSGEDAPHDSDDAIMVSDEDVVDASSGPEDITDEDLEAFEAAMVASAAQAAMKWWPAVSQSGESEKAGARMRRDRSPTEEMVRPLLTGLQRLKRFVSARAAVVVVASAVLGTLIGLTLRAVHVQNDSEVLTDPLPLPTFGPPSELAEPLHPDLAPPTDTPEIQSRRIREAKPASSVPAIKAPPKCASAKCRPSSTGHAKKTRAAAPAAAKLESKNALSAGLTGSVDRRATMSDAPKTTARRTVVVAQGR